MRQVTFPSYMGFKYRAVHKVTEWKDGCIYKTKQVGFLYTTDFKDIIHLIPSDYVLCSLSTSLTSQPKITLDLMEPRDFGLSVQ